MGSIIGVYRNIIEQNGVQGHKKKYKQPRMAVCI